MTDDQDEILDDVLSRWHSWMDNTRLSRGFDRMSACGTLYRASQEYDDENGKTDAALEDIRCRAVDYQVGQMVHPHRTAIFIIAKNLSTGTTVWNSPRLPQRGEELRTLEREARTILARRLIDAGVM